MADDEPRLVTPQPVDPVLLRELRATLQEIRDRIGAHGDIHAGIEVLCKVAGRQFRDVFIAMYKSDFYVRRPDKRSLPMPIDFIYTRDRNTIEPADGPTDVYTYTQWKGTAVRFEFPRDHMHHDIPISPYYYQNDLYQVESEALPSDEEYATLGRRFGSAVDAWIRWIDKRLPVDADENVKVDEYAPEQAESHARENPDSAGDEPDEIKRLREIAETAMATKPKQKRCVELLIERGPKVVDELISQSESLPWSRDRTIGAISVSELSVDPVVDWDLSQAKSNTLKLMQRALHNTLKPFGFTTARHRNHLWLGKTLETGS